MMTSLKSYQDLEVWKKSMDLAELVYRLSSRFPQEEKFGLTSQIRRAAVSLPANIAEGAERNATGEFLQFLGIASGSLAETETFLILAVRLGMVTNEQTSQLQTQAADIGKMLNGLKRSLRSKN
ncbi:MAG: four helix bundle protein [Desulfobulbaceae bacterium A2]|nr:MAG: four helix bundle protein [Desulfobulbaceae bacterium A2]